MKMEDITNNNSSDQKWLGGSLSNGRIVECKPRWFRTSWLKLVEEINTSNLCSCTSDRCRKQIRDTFYTENEENISEPDQCDCIVPVDWTHRYQVCNNPPRENIDSHYWCFDLFELAKCFMPPSGCCDKILREVSDCIIVKRNIRQAIKAESGQESYVFIEVMQAHSEYVTMIEIIEERTGKELDFTYSIRKNGSNATDIQHNSLNIENEFSIDKDNDQAVVMDPRFVTHQDVQTNSDNTFDTINEGKVSIDEPDLLNIELKGLEGKMQNDDFKQGEAKCCSCACERFQKIPLQDLEHKTSEMVNKVSDVTESLQNIEHNTREIVKNMSNMTEILLVLKEKMTKMLNDFECKDKIPIMTNSEDPCELECKADSENVITRPSKYTYTTSHALSSSDKVSHVTRNQSTQISSSDLMLATSFLRGELTGRGEDATILKTVHSTSTDGSYKNLSTGLRRGCTVLDPPTTDWLLSIETRQEPEQTVDDLKLPDPTQCLSSETDIKSLINLQDKCSNENLAGNENDNFRSSEQTLSSGYPVSTISSKGMTCTRSDLLENDSLVNCDFERELDNSLSVTTSVNLVNDLDDVSNAEKPVSCNKQGRFSLNKTFAVLNIKEETLQVEDHEDDRSNDYKSSNKVDTTNETINSIEYENSDKRNKVENIVIETPRERPNDSGEVNEEEEERIHDVVYSDNEAISAHLEENDDILENENYASDENSPKQEIKISKYQDDLLNESEGNCNPKYPVKAFSSTLRPSSFVHASCGSTDEDINSAISIQVDDKKEDMIEKISNQSEIENYIGFRSNRKRKIQLSDSDFDYMDLKRYKATTLEEKTWNFIWIQGKNEKVLGCLFDQCDCEFQKIHLEVLVVGVDGILRQVDPLAKDHTGKERKRSFSETDNEVKDGSVNSTYEQEDISDDVNKPALSVTANEVGDTKFSKLNYPVIYNVKHCIVENCLNCIQSLSHPKEQKITKNEVWKKGEKEIRKCIWKRICQSPETCSMCRHQLSLYSSTDDDSTLAYRAALRRRHRKHSEESSGREESLGSSPSAERVTFRRRNRKNSEKLSGSSTSVGRETFGRRNRKHSEKWSGSSPSADRVTFRRRNRKHLEESSDRSPSAERVTIRRTNRKHSEESSGREESSGSSSAERVTFRRRNRKRSKQSAGCSSSANKATYRKCSQQFADSSSSATTAAWQSRNDLKKPETCTEADNLLESFDSGIELSAQCQYQILNELSHKLATVNISSILGHKYETVKPSVCSHIPLLERQKVRVKADSSQLKDMHKNYEKRMNQYFKDKGSLTLEDFVKELHINHSTVQVFGLTEYFNRLTRGESLSDQQRMQYEWLRLASFQHYTGNGNALSLARNGLYHDPTDGPTSTRCYLCEARNSAWEYFDNIEAEHRRQSPDCPFHSNRSEESTNVSISYETPSQSHGAPPASTPSVQSTVSLPGNSSTGSASLSQTQTPSQNIYQPQENDENSQHSLLALPNSRSFRALGRSGETAYSHLTTPPRKNNISINASLDGFASSVPTSTAANTEFSSIPTSIATNTVSNSLPTSTATSTSSVSIQQSSIPSRAIAAGAFGGFNAPTSTSISTSSSTTSTSTSQSVSAPAVAAASSLQQPSQTPIGGEGLKAAVSSHLRPSQTPIGGGGRTDPTITVVVENAKHPDYRELDTRINSYQGWPDYLDQTARQMAEAGFFFVGVADFTRCFCCGGGLRNWEPGDDPMLEHTRWFPRCEYVNKLKGERYVAAVQRRHQQHMEEQQRQQQELARSRDANRNPPDPMSTEAAAVLREMGYQQERIKDAILTVRRQIGVPDVTTQQVLAWLLDQHEARSSPTSTRSSPTRDLGVKVNATLPSSSIQTSSQSSVITSTPSVSTTTSAGLTGSSSSVVCSTLTSTGAGSQQSGSSTSTTSSSSSTEAGRKPTSQTGSKENGAKEGKSLGKQAAASGGDSDEEFKSAEETLSPDTKSAKKKNRKKNKAKSGAKPSDAPSKLNVVDTQALKEENEKLREMQTCKICMERLVNTTLLPCGHLVCCDVCAARLNRCPICRKRIKGTVKTFMS